MNKKFALYLIILTATLALAACGGNPAPATNDATVVKNNNVKTDAAPPATNAGHVADDETPAAVKAAFPAAQTFTKQHRDIPADKIAALEKETGGKVPDTDHHSYLAFTNANGTRQQLGAVTQVTAAGNTLIIAYENRSGMPVIREVSGNGGLPSPFLAQFKGKTHDDKFQVGGDIKEAGVEPSQARAVTAAIRMDVLTMQTLYGTTHTH